MTYSAPLAPTLIRLWNGEGVAKVDANFVSSPRIRIEFADVLLQMHRNGFGGLNAKAYEDYARSLVKSVDPDVARQAVLVLGVANNPKDVGLLSAIFADSGSRHWRAAALGLVGNCGVSESIIERMSEGAIPERGRFLRETWTAQKGYRAC